MHERQLPLACLAALALAACSPSGVRVDVYATVPLDRLVLYGAVDDGQDRFVIDPRLDGSTVDVSGRALARAPYQLLVQPDDGARKGARVVVAVVGRRGDQDLVWGELEPPQPLPDGEIVVRRIDLVEFTAAPFSAVGTSCLLVPDGRSLGSRDDHDCDGYVSVDAGGDDCDDEDPSINPGQSEVCGNGKDDNCNGVIDENVDNDGDGVKTCDGDCDDNDPTVFPGAPEICDGKDNDCNGRCDETFDADGDRYTTCGSRIATSGACSAPPSPFRVDCDDHDANVHPNALEVCNGKDDNCNGRCDEGFDLDGDTYTTCGSRTGQNGFGACVAASGPADCNDGDAQVHPGAREVCDGLDDDCDGARAPAGTAEFCLVASGPGACSVGLRSCDDSTPPGFTGACTPLDVSAQDAYCASYAACDAMTEVHDKLACTAAAVPASILLCNLAFDVAGLCPGADFVLPGPASGSCSWTLDGAVVRDSYMLGILDDAGLPQTTSAACMPRFGVTAFAGLPGTQAQTAALLTVTSAAVTNDVALLIAPISVASCPQAALDCK